MLGGKPKEKLYNKDKLYTNKDKVFSNKDKVYGKQEKAFNRAYQAGVIVEITALIYYWLSILCDLLLQLHYKHLSLIEGNITLSLSLSLSLSLPSLNFAFFEDHLSFLPV